MAAVRITWMTTCKGPRIMPSVSATNFHYYYFIFLFFIFLNFHYYYFKLKFLKSIIGFFMKMEENKLNLFFFHSEQFLL